MPYIDPSALDLTRLFSNSGPPRPPKPDTKLHRVTIYVPDRDIETTRVRGIGYKQLSPCGLFTAREKTVRDVRAAMHKHRQTCPNCKQLELGAPRREREH